MNAELFNVTLLFAVLVLGLFSFLVGGKSEKAKTQKETGDENGFITTIHDLVKMTAASVVVLAGTAVAVLVALVVTPDSLLVPAGLIGNPVVFVFNFLAILAVGMVGGFYVGVVTQDKLYKISQKSTPSLLPVLSVLGVFALVGRVAASNMTDQMAPVTEILTWAGVDMVPAVLVLILALVPLIMIMIGVRFAGGMLSGLMEGIKEIFSFKF